MNIRVMSRNEALAHSYKQEIPKCAIISICCHNDHNPIFYLGNTESRRVMGVLRLKFNDIESDCGDYIAPKQGDFVGLKAFIDTIKQNPEIEDIIVHCAAGISRSSAIAAAICQYLGLNEYDIIWSNANYHPNTLVYKLAINELGLKWCEAQFAYYLAMNKLERDKMEIPSDFDNLFK